MEEKKILTETTEPLNNDRLQHRSSSQNYNDGNSAHYVVAF